MSNRHNLYFDDDTEARLRRVAERENLRDQRGNISLSAAVRWLAEQDSRKTAKGKK